MSPEEAARLRFLQRIHDRVNDLITEAQSDTAGDFGDRIILEQPLAMVRDYCKRELGRDFEPQP